MSEPNNHPPLVSSVRDLKDADKMPYNVAVMHYDSCDLFKQLSHYPKGGKQSEIVVFIFGLDNSILDNAQAQKFSDALKDFANGRTNCKFFLYSSRVDLVTGLLDRSVILRDCMIVNGNYDRAEIGPLNGSRSDPNLKGTVGDSIANGEIESVGQGAWRFPLSWKTT